MSTPLERELDNPVWASLRSRHRDLARGDDRATRYPADVAPFLGVAEAWIEARESLEACLAPGESALLVGVPPSVPPGWQLRVFPEIAQMVCDAAQPIPDGPEIVMLGHQQHDDVQALTALVYPHYFRRRTTEMGRYFGLYVDGRLAAMAGERMGTVHAREISAVCTHPDFTGRGYAQRLLATLANDLLGQGLQPFLHVSHSNVRAKAVYERAGWRTRRDIGFWELVRG